MTGTRLLAALGLILLATAVLPSAAAWRLNRSRVRMAAHDAAGIADALRHIEPNLRVVASTAMVLSGPGRLPSASAPAAERWVTMPRAELVAVVGDRHPLSADPWDNCYLVNLAEIAATGSTTVWILSAGPNGMIETPFVTPSGTPAGDDVGMRVP